MEKDLTKISDYIIRFLLGNENAEFAKHIGYYSDKDDYSGCKLVIRRSNFFDPDIYGTTQSYPALPLSLWKDIPLLFGSPETKKSGNTLILHADIIASTFFLISRYEEVILRDERDQHGRFPGKKSLAFKAGFLQRPLVDEYGAMLRKLLRETGYNITEPSEKFRKIYLTHDVDQLAHYRNFRGMGGAVSRFFKNPYQSLKALQTYFGSIQNDPWYTFPWLFELAEELKTEKSGVEIENVIFIKTGGGDLMTDKPLHDVRDKDFNRLFSLCKQFGVKIGLHPSYQAGMNPDYIQKEKKILDETTDQQTTYSRNHFLNNREPEHMQALIEAGITDDFTMAYADIAGFRLGTSRPVKWINPLTGEITDLTLHPLILMDSTLSDERYMKLRADEAFSYSKKMIDLVKKHNGDLVLLWHNTTVEKHNGQYHRDLYRWMINYLKMNL
ncbi:MAG: polysaccharide deacetylase family protein [Paludibacteraceae bacterium]